MQNKIEILLPVATYHVYNRANGSERLFLSAENYQFFLKKYQEHVSPVADTFCYCLMPNHFHFLIGIKSVEELKEYLEKKRKNLQGFKNLEGLQEEDFADLLSNQFSNFFNGYSKAFNKMHGRKGSLFMHTFKRKKVTDAPYLLKLVHYIHYNPIVSGLCEKPEEWPHSSYPAVVKEENNFIKASELISWFQDKENFIYFHSQPVEQLQM